MISLTSKAVARVKDLLAQQHLESGGLRVGVVGGGCSGLSYKLDLETQARPHDKVFHVEGVTLFVDPKSFIYLRGMTLDFSDGLDGRGFVFMNPNATRTCGCGSSFSA